MKVFFLVLSVFHSAFSQAKTNHQNVFQKPNIIFILTDDQRWDALGYAGNKYAHTPQMDKLAKEGSYFNRAMVSTPICSASRASILSGLYERTHRYSFDATEVNPVYMQEAYPSVLKRAGYYTGFYGKLGVKYNQADKLFNEFEDYDRNNNFNDKRGYFYKMLASDTVHLTRYTGQKALDFIENVSSEKPFCLSLSFSAPHAHDGALDQYFWDEQTDDLLKDVTIPPANLSDEKYFNEQPEKVKAGFNHLRWTWRFDNPEKYQRMVKGYYKMLAGVDIEIGRIREQLKKKGLDKNTVIILMGDNGYFLGERQFAGKWLMYDLSVRVPLIIYDPRNAKHQDIDEMVLNVDVPATMADLAGIRQPDNWHGKSLYPIVSGKQKSLHRDTVLIEHLWEFESIPPSEGIRTTDWKYFRYVNEKSWEELYDLKKDAQEINNLAKNTGYEKVLINLRHKTNELIKKRSDPLDSVPSELKVEFKPADELKSFNPTYNWIVPKVAGTQMAYQILVASSKANLDNNTGDVWDSGVVKRNSSTANLHTGKTVNDGINYFWKVRIWDQFYRLSDYSQTQTFQK